MRWYYYTSSNGELYHHGILGMKWGIRRYQPYPVGYHGGGREIGAAAKVQQRHTIKKYTSPNKELAKQAFKSAATKTLLPLIPGAATVYNINQARKMTSYFDKTDYTKKEGPIEKISELKRKTTVMSTKEDMKQVNPRLFGDSSKGKIHNCSYCSAAMDLRKRGYDVQARSKAEGCHPDIWKTWYKNAKIEKPPKLQRESGENRRAYVNRSYDNLCNTLEKQGDGARGQVAVSWDGNPFSGHSIFYEVTNGRVQFYDAQANTMDVDKVFALADPDMHEFVRLDNLKLNESVAEAVVSKKRGRK